ncbi:MAG: cation:proton antiporter, partial [Nitrospinae bacterium]|nr:cation:proton antiporter [Nitrospinota bacterium]
LSSTAIVLKMIADRGEIDTLHGRLSIGILLLQDISVIPMMLVIPLLAQTVHSTWLDIALALLKSAFALAFIFLVSRLLVPRALVQIAKTKNKEHLTLFVILIIMGTGWVSQALGLSLAMGAFIAGLIISESEYNHQIILDILPLRDYFVSVFFISVGMLLDVRVFLGSPWLYLGLTLAIVVSKTALASLASLAMKNPPRISLIVGIRLAQVGEFSLLIADTARTLGLFAPSEYQSFLIVSILTMLASPLFIQFSTQISERLSSRMAVPSPEEGEEEKKALSDHVIIAGYGLGGRHLARVLKETHIPFIALDLDGERIKRAIAERIPALYGDATHRDILRRAGIATARMMVFSISDYASTRQGVKLARQLNPDLYIMVRTRYASQVEELKSNGASEVIPEEFETSIEVFSRALKEYRIPNNVIEQQIELVRLEGYAMFRGISLSAQSMGKFSAFLTASLTESFVILDDSWANGKTLGEIELSARTGVMLIAVVRARKAHPRPAPDFLFQDGDILILFGNHAELNKSLKLLQSGPEGD